MRDTHSDRITIGLIAENPTWPADSYITESVRRAALDAGVNFVYLTLHDQLRESIQWLHIDGLLIIGWAQEYQSAELLEQFRDTVGQLPIVSIGRALEGIPSIIVPGHPPVKELTEHLIRVHGHKRIAYIEPLNGFDDRLDGYLEAMSEHGLSTDGLIVTNKDLGEAGDIDIYDREIRALHILQHDRKVTLDAVIVMSATEGKRILSVLADQGRRVPDDIAICCYEEDVSTRFAEPPLTTIYYPFDEVGTAGLHSLLRILHGQESELVEEVNARVKVRHSCGCKMLSNDDLDYSSVFRRFLAKDTLNTNLTFMGRNLLAAYHTSKIIELTNHNLSWLNIPSCHIFQYREGRYKLILASENGNNHTHLYDENTDIATLFKSYSKGKTEPFSITVIPLIFENERTGFTWVEQGSHTATTIFTLFDFIKTALVGAIMWEESQNMIHQFAELADTDGLTGLFNRRVFYATLRAAVSSAKPFSLLFFDIDGFKSVNDTYGHETGDILLTRITERISYVLSSYTYPLVNQTKYKHDKIAIFRLGGDEFTAILSELAPDKLAELLRQLTDTLGAPFTINDNIVRISCSIGISIYPLHATDSDLLLRQADQAMYQAKSKKNTYSFYDS